MIPKKQTFIISFTLLQVGTSWVKYLAMLQKLPMLILVSQFFELTSHLVYSNHKRAQ